MEWLKRNMIAVGMACVMAVQPALADDYGAVKDEQTFRKELVRKTSATTSIQARFVQEKYLSVFSSTVKSEGLFWWQKSDRICLDYRTPVKYRIVIAGDRIKTVSGGKATVISIKGNPMMDQMSQLIASCMTGNLAAMGAGFSTLVQESAEDYRITITPVDKSVKNYIARMEIHLDKSDLSVDRLVMYENEADYTAYIFSEKKFNETIPAQVFDVR